MRLIIQEEKSLEIIPCECGEYPKFKHIDYYTDTLLECPNCGKHTRNTGGYHYASEIPLKQAKEDAIKAWNNREYIR